MTRWLDLVRDHQAHGFTDLPAEGRSWHDGAWGEILVGQELAFMSPEWHVLHAVPAGRAGADIDHLVIGPGGVFVLNTKRHPNATIRVGSNVVWINGFRQGHYQSAIRRRCDQVGQVLLRTTGERLVVHPVLVFVQPRRVSCSGDQWVLSATAQGLVGLLRSMPVTLTTEQVRALVSAAGRPSSWGASEQVLLQPDPTADFLALSATPPCRRLTVPHRTSRPSRRSSSPRPIPRPLRLLVGLVALAVGLPFASLMLSALVSAWTNLLIAH